MFSVLKQKSKVIGCNKGLSFSSWVFWLEQGQIISDSFGFDLLDAVTTCTIGVGQLFQKQTYPSRWAPTSYKWSYKPYKWPYKWVTGVITLLIGVITPFITSRGPTLFGK